MSPLGDRPPLTPVESQTDRPEVVTDEAVELVLRHHLPVPLEDSTVVLCLCDVQQTYAGPVGHRLHVAAELRRAGMLRPHPDVTADSAHLTAAPPDLTASAPDRAADVASTTTPKDSVS